MGIIDLFATPGQQTELKKAIDKSKLIKKKVQVRGPSGKVHQAYRYVKPDGSTDRVFEKHGQDADQLEGQKKGQAIQMLINHGVLDAKDIIDITGATTTQVYRLLKEHPGSAPGRQPSAAAEVFEEPAEVHSEPVMDEPAGSGLPSEEINLPWSEDENQFFGWARDSLRGKGLDPPGKFGSRLESFGELLQKEQQEEREVAAFQARFDGKSVGSSREDRENFNKLRDLGDALKSTRNFMEKRAERLAFNPKGGFVETPGELKASIKGQVAMLSKEGTPIANRIAEELIAVGENRRVLAAGEIVV